MKRIDAGVFGYTLNGNYTPVGLAVTSDDVG